MLATAVLITREDQYPQEVLDSLPPFDEVLIETNCKSVFRRFELALQARNELIYVQDDDCIIDVEKLFKEYDGSITSAITEHHKRFYQGTKMSLIGWGAFFPKRMIDFTPYLSKYGMNDLFLSQADRVFTYLNPHKSIVMDIIHLPSATAAGRMSTSPGHWENLEKIKQQLETL